SFVETVAAMHPYYVIRAFGGVLFLCGALIMVYNLIRTMRREIRVEEEPGRVMAAPVPAPAE
ncbi:MAG: cytochrome oxidase, partial [Geminicoccaceae bacterium]